MKKIFIKVSGIAVCLTVLLANVSLSKNETSKDTNLLEISLAKDANAECPPATIQNGRCTLLYNCYPNPGGYVDCNFMQ